MLSYFRHLALCTEDDAVAASRARFTRALPKQHLSGKPIRYYRPTGSPDVRRADRRGFQAFNAGRLSEACQIFADKMLDARRTTRRSA